MKTRILNKSRDPYWRQEFLMKTGILMKIGINTEDRDSYWRQGFLLKTGILAEVRDS